MHYVGLAAGTNEICFYQPDESVELEKRNDCTLFNLQELLSRESSNLVK